MAIAFDSSSSGGSASSPATFSHTCSGSDRILFVAAAANSGQTVTGVTYNGVSMTQLNSVTDSATQYLFYLIAPATGTNNVVVSTSGSNATGSAVSYTGVKQSAFPDAQNTTAGATTTSYAQSLTSITDKCWFISTSRTGNGFTLTGTGGTTVRVQPENTYLGANGMWDYGPKTPAGLQTLTVTCTSQVFGGGILASFAPSAVNLTITATTQAYALTGIDVILRRGISMIASAGSFILTGISIAFGRTGWVKQAKNTTTWTDVTKNTTSWTDSTKNTTNWTNQQKN